MIRRMCKMIEDFMNPPNGVYSIARPYCGNPIGTFFMMLSFYLILIIAGLGAAFDKDGFYTFIAITIVCTMSVLAGFLDKKIA